MRLEHRWNIFGTFLEHLSEASGRLRPPALPPWPGRAISGHRSSLPRRRRSSIMHTHTHTLTHTRKHVHTRARISHSSRHASPAQYRVLPSTEFRVSRLWNRLHFSVRHRSVPRKSGRNFVAPCARFLVAVDHRMQIG